MKHFLQPWKKKGFETPSAIQAAVIPLALSSDKDIIGQAQTGTGKTAAFSLPIIEQLDESANCVQALVLCPTRELAIQVAEEINSFLHGSKLSATAIYGGQNITEQLRRIKKGVDIVVGTPGRVIDHIKRKTLKLGGLKFAVLDEADEMLNMGFIEDIEFILESSAEDKRMLMFSATMPPRLKATAETYLKEVEHVAIKSNTMTTSNTDQIYYEVADQDRFEALSRIVDIEEDFYGMVFCRTKVDVEKLTGRLLDRGYSAEYLHGDISQAARERILDKFRKKRINILICTDVAARGIDINDLTHVINYALPQDPESYVHRIGRTGRAGRQGTAITFVSPAESRKLLHIKRKTKTEIRKEELPEVSELFEIKKTRLLDEIENLANSGEAQKFMKLATEILDRANPAAAVAALLKHTLEDELDCSQYKELKKFDSVSGRSKLYIAKGRIDNMSPKKILAYICDRSGVPGKVVQDIKIFEKYTLLTVPFREAEVILKSFKKSKRGRNPMVKKAREN